MFSRLEFFIAFRYLKSKKQESFISVVAIFSLIGIALGVAALISVMAVMAGVREQWTDKIIGAGGDLNIYAKNSNSFANYDQVATKIISIPEVSSAIPILEKQALISFNQNNIGVQVRGLKLDDLEKKKIIAEKIISGDLKKILSKDAVVLGASLANNLGVRVGDDIKIISSQTNATFIGNLPRIKTCEVAAIFDSGMADFDSFIVFLPLKLAQNFFRSEDKVSYIEVTTNDSSKIDVLRKNIDRKLVFNFRLVDWKQRNSALMGALETERVAMFLILTLIMLVAAFNIISSLIMLVKDKTGDIAILRTMGATRNMMVKIFLICGSSIGFFGTILGTILGISFASNIDAIRIFLQNITGTTIFDPLVYYLAFLPAKIYLSDLFTITLMALTLSFLATIYPAYRAAKLNPARALKN